MVDTRFSVSVQIMMSLAYHEDELLNSEALAKTLKTNATFIRRLVANLVEADLIKSYRGKGGGIKLAKPLYAINLKDIYLAATNEKTLVRAHKKPVTKACPVSCCIEGVLDEIVCGIETTTQGYLVKKTLSDLMKQVN
ncbi:MAG: Rrf2 family transcriptional regulator [Bacteriovoracaceae bacterium]|nr:Rrf2 family transcriptional regulator [Bacteriovoracaceae bacterium]